MPDKLLELRAAITDRELKRLRPKRSLRGWVNVALILALAWALSDTSVSPSLLNFPKTAVGISSEFMLVRLTNRTLKELRPAVRLEGESASDFRADPASCATVERGETCVLRVQFRPHETGSKRARLIVSVTPEKNLGTELLGTAVVPKGPPADHESNVVSKVIMRIEPEELDFTSQPNQVQQVRVFNDGDATLHIRTCVQGGNPDRFEEVEPHGCDATLNVPAGDNRVISIRYKPHVLMWKGTYSAVLQVDHDAQNISTPQRVVLRWARVVTPNPWVDRQPPPQQFVTLTIDMRADASCSTGARGSVIYGKGSECEISSKSCQVSVAKGTNISLTARPGSGTTFSSFSGACSGKKPCTLTMTDDMSVGATFCGLIQ